MLIPNDAVWGGEDFARMLHLAENITRPRIVQRNGRTPLGLPLALELNLSSRTAYMLAQSIWEGLQLRLPGLVEQSLRFILWQLQVGQGRREACLKSREGTGSELDRPIVLT